MAIVFHNKKMVRDKVTGKHIVVKDKEGNPLYCEAWLARYYDHRGIRVQVQLPATTEKEAQKMADQLESKERAIKSGLLPKPTPAILVSKKTFSEVADEYMEWGMAQGGRKGRPWSKQNTKKRRYYLNWWKTHLGAMCIADLYGTLAVAEKALRGLMAQGKAGKTLGLYREGLLAFCFWCKDREYLDRNPFEKLALFDTTPVRVRRDMTREEIEKLLAVSPLHRRILYETAFSSGFRSCELKSLNVSDVDVENSSLRLSASADKARKARIQPISPGLAKRLAEYGKSGDALKKYKASYWKAGKKLSTELPENPLLYVPSQPSRTIKRDLKKAGIPISTAAGVLDFHACRVAYINLVIKSGADVKTAQELARHATAEMTMRFYARPQDTRLTKAARTVGDAVANLIAFEEAGDDSAITHCKIGVSPDPPMGLTPVTKVFNSTRRYQDKCRNLKGLRFLFDFLFCR